jgi:DNA-binding SARP family transcriptional activator/Tfp pilus assembly protein PilF
MQVRLLGPVDLLIGGVSRPVRGLRRKAMLAMLALHRGRIVSLDRLVDVIWGDAAPPTAVNTAQSHVSHLRQVLGDKTVIQARPPGYVLNLDADGTDVDVAERLVRRGIQATDPSRRAQQLQAALALWRGRPLADVVELTWLAEQADRLDGVHLLAERALTEARLALGEHASVLPDLDRLIRDHPFDEQLQRQRMLALYRAGRQADALAAYRELRRVLDEDLGIGPSQPLRDLEAAILRQDPALAVTPPLITLAPTPAGAAPAPPATAAPAPAVGPPSTAGPPPPAAAVAPAAPALPATGAPARDRSTARPAAPPADPAPAWAVAPRPAPAPRPVPALLPPAVSAFTGRERELAELDAMTAVAGSATRATTAIAAVSGTAGVGKTALAVAWAHRVAARFPDGQLFLDLRGYDPEQPVPAAAALARLLAALGVPGDEIPFDLDERTDRYRTEIAGRRLLVVLDNAASTEQVRPLLPGTPTAMVVVTSRDSLAGLVALHGARRLDLGLLPEADAVALLGELIGARVETEPAAATALAARCARLPLALRIAAELAATRPSTPLADLVDELTDQQRRLDMLDVGGDPRGAVRAVLSWSYRQLPPAAAQLFRLAGLHPACELDAYAAAALAGTSLEVARRTLDLLARAHLTQPAGADRYCMHDLLRAYGASLAQREGGEPDRQAALGRLFDYYLGASAAAMDRLHPAEQHRRPAVAAPASRTPAFADAAAARGWLDAERPTLAAIAGYTAAHGWPEHTVRLSSTLFRYLAGGHYPDALAIHGHASLAAQEAGDPAGEAAARIGLGTVYMRMSEPEQAADELRQALALFRQTGDLIGQARALGSLGNVEARLRCGVAAQHHRRALALFRQAGDRTGQARALSNLGGVERRLGQYGPAVDHQRQALDLFRQIGDVAGTAWALTTLGDAETDLGRYLPGANAHRQALDLFRQIGDVAGEGWALTGIGDVHTRLGQPDQAVEHHQQAVDLFRALGDRAGEEWALNGLGEAAQAAGQPTEALEWHTRALAVAQVTGSRDQQARAHAGLGRVHQRLGDHTPAREHLHRARSLFTALSSPEAAQISAELAALGEAKADGQDSVYRITV